MSIFYVIDKSTKDLVRFGCCDFQNDGTFDSNTQEIIEGNYNLNFMKNYRYNESTNNFDEV